MNKPDHTSKFVRNGTTGEKIEPEKYHPSILEKLQCFLGFHYVCGVHHETPQGRYCLKCEKFY